MDFDRIPSPHPPNSTRRGAGHAGPGPSSLRHSARNLDSEPESQSESENEPAGDYSGGGYDDDDDAEQADFDNFGQQDSPENQRTPRQSNFSTIEEADEEEEEAELEGVEDEIAQGLEDVGLDMESQEEESEHEPEPPVKKTKVAEEKKKATTKTQTRSKKENRRPYLIFLLPMLC